MPQPKFEQRSVYRKIDDAPGPDVIDYVWDKKTGAILSDDKVTTLKKGDYVQVLSDGPSDRFDYPYWRVLLATHEPGFACLRGHKWQNVDTNEVIDDTGGPPTLAECLGISR